MPRRPSGNTVAVSIKVPQEWLDEADEFVELAAKTAINRPTRTDLLRFALRAGLNAMADLHHKTREQTKAHASQRTKKVHK
jgi:hypothetical protein